MATTPLVVSDRHRIVAEVSKTWKNGTSDTPGLLCQRFEGVIEENSRRGYTLENWQFSQIYIESENQMIETVVAVFVRTLERE